MVPFIVDTYYTTRTGRKVLVKIKTFAEAKARLEEIAALRAATVEAAPTHYGDIDHDRDAEAAAINRALASSLSL